MLVEGYIQSSPEQVTHLVAQRLTDRSHDLADLANAAFRRKPAVPAGPALIEPLNDDPREHLRQPGAKNPPSAQRAHPAAVEGFSLRVSIGRQVRKVPDPVVIASEAKQSIERRRKCGLLRR